MSWEYFSKNYIFDPTNIGSSYYQYLPQRLNRRILGPETTDSKMTSIFTPIFTDTKELILRRVAEKPVLVDSHM